MKTFYAQAALLWKEFREQKWFALAGVLLFCGMPLILATLYYFTVKNYNPQATPRFWSNEGVGVVLGFSGTFAIFLAVAATCRDLSEPLYTFWRSRPIGVMKLLVTKYVVGLFVLLATTWGGLLITMWMYVAAFPMESWYKTEAFGAGLCHTPVLILIFSIAFLLGCLIRHSARAAVFSLMAGLLIYFLPVLVPSMTEFSVLNILDLRPWRMDSIGIQDKTMVWIWYRYPAVWFILRQLYVFLPLLIACAIGSIAAVVVACVAVVKQWQLRADKKVLSGALVGVVLVLVLIASLQVGSNMKCVSIWPISPAGTSQHFNASAVAIHGNRGILLAYPSRERWISSEVQLGVCTLDDMDGLRCGPWAELKNVNGRFHWELPSFCWSHEEPNRLYCVTHQLNESSGLASMELLTIALDADASWTIIHRLDLTEQIQCEKYISGPWMCRMKDRLYISTGNQFLTLDIANRDEPKLIAETPLYGESKEGRRFSYYWRKINYTTIDTLEQISLWPMEGLSPQERMEVTLQLAHWGYSSAIEGDLLYQVPSRKNGLEVYRLTLENDDTIKATLLGRYTPSPLERMIGFFPKKIVVRNGVAYLLHYGSHGITAYDVRNPSAIRRVGHYGSKGRFIRDIAFLDDGNLLLVGETMEIVEPVMLK